jgi:hypothetical protein
VFSIAFLFYLRVLGCHPRSDNFTLHNNHNISKDLILSYYHAITSYACLACHQLGLLDKPVQRYHTNISTSSHASSAQNDRISIVHQLWIIVLYLFVGFNLTATILTRSAAHLSIMDQRQFQQLIQQLQQSLNPPAPAVAFARTPGQAAPTNVIDYSTSTGIKLWQEATAPLTVPFWCQCKRNQHFHRAITRKSSQIWMECRSSLLRLPHSRC